MGESRTLLETNMKALTHSTILQVVISLLLATRSMAAGPDSYSVADFGAKGDGKTDDTAAFQKALDTAGKAGGGVVYAPRGNYYFTGHLNVPAAVTLKGMWESVPAHNGIRDAGLPKPTDDELEIGRSVDESSWLYRTVILFVSLRL